jgi:hypothetical protein
MKTAKLQPEVEMREAIAKELFRAGVPFDVVRSMGEVTAVAWVMCLNASARPARRRVRVHVPMRLRPVGRAHLAPRSAPATGVTR